MSLIALAFAAALQAQTPTVSEAVVQPPAQEDAKVVCRREVVTGSNKRVKVCRKQDDLDDLSFEARRRLDERLRNGARTSATRVPGYVPRPGPGGG